MEGVCENITLLCIYIRKQDINNLYTFSILFFFFFWDTQYPNSIPSLPVFAGTVNVSPLKIQFSVMIMSNLLQP